MSNHDHLLVETVEPNLSQGMRQLEGFYSRHFNRLHKLVGHVFQGRYKAILVRKENYLLAYRSDADQAVSSKAEIVFGLR